MARHRREDVLDPFAEQQAFAVQGEVVGEIAQQRLGIGLGERAGHRAHQHRAGTEPLDRQAEPGERPGLLLEPVAGGFVELDHRGHQQRLARGDLVARPRGAQPFEHQALVRGVLVDDHQPVGGLGDDIGLRDLAARDAERIVRLGRDRLGRLGAALRGGHDLRLDAAPGRLRRAHRTRPVASREDRAQREAGVDGLEFTPGWAVGWFFVPIANLFKPFQAMRELWTASHGEADRFGGEAPTEVKLWWGAWLVGNIASTVGTRIILMGEGEASSLVVGTALGGIGTVVIVLAAILLAKVIAGVTAAQRGGGTAVGVFA